MNTSPQGKSAPRTPSKTDRKARQLGLDQYSETSSEERAYNKEREELSAKYRDIRQRIYDHGMP